MTLDTSIEYLSGVGSRRGEKYGNLGISTISDLLFHFPRTYLDLSNPYSIMEAPLHQPIPVKATLTYKSPEQPIRRGLSIFRLIAEDEEGQLHMTLFNSKYKVAQLVVGQEYLFYGSLEGNLLKRTLSNPAIYPQQDSYPILPIYPQTQGIQSQLMRLNIQQIFNELPPLPDPLPEDIRLKYSLGELNACLQEIHFPSSLEGAEFARKRFVFQELLTLSCGLYSLRAGREVVKVSPMTSVPIEPFYSSLPYTPTSAQRRCIKEAVQDMQGTQPMNRLIQGDVGSGKTLVAGGAIYFVAQNKIQSALMVPTEILAEQHFNTMVSLLAPFNITVALLTGSTKAAQRREVLEGLESGRIDLCVGTHALLSSTISFNNLGLVITDEQHRFGVAQRATLSQKSEGVHVLVMSATPIPRTLSLIIYGDLSLSLLDEMPPGRQPVDTLLINSSKLIRALGFVRKNVDEGRQAYLVYPLIEQGEVDLGLASAVERKEQLSKLEFKGYSLGLLHGQMKAKDKEEEMRKFKEGKTQILLSTTVVEVGVDVPNATIMLIENAERFGLSQLHQLRGRVGRGEDKSYCILVSDAKEQTARQRLMAMKEINDGFQLAEYDLKLRGPGDFFGYRQHGLPELRVASLSENMDIMVEAQECALTILKQDPLLELEKHSLLRIQVEGMLASVGDRPN